MVIETLDRLGLKVIPKWRWREYPLATLTREIFSLLSVDCVLDVGANKGQYAQFLRKHVDYKGEILSFEPIPNLAQALANRAKADPFWHVFPCALGAKEEYRPINVTDGSTLHSFLTPVPSGVDYIDQLNKVIRSEMVPVRTVDSILNERKSFGKKSIFLKMDTQGYDQEVMQGATESLHHISALQTEISCLPIYKDMKNYVQSLAFLQKMGFDTIGMIPVNRDKWLRVVEYDCLAINRIHINDPFKVE